MESTQIFVAAYVNQFFAERGIIGYPNPDDFSSEVVRWLDPDALDQLRVALTALRADWKARKGHKLAGELLAVIENETSAISPARSQIFRRANQKAERYLLQTA
jgi:hypothetical protein